MTTRRRFMQIAAATAAPLALGGNAALAGTAAQAAPGATHRFVLFESSLAPATAFARRARSHGAATIELRHGDITDAWLRSVRPAWQRQRASIAGLTTPAAVFCLEQFAIENGMRVVFHAEHLLLADGGVVHQLHRTPDASPVAALHLAADRWPQRLADSLLNPRPRRPARPGPSLAALEPALPAGATLLTSWIIA